MGLPFVLILSIPTNQFHLLPDMSLERTRLAVAFVAILALEGLLQRVPSDVTLQVAGLHKGCAAVAARKQLHIRMQSQMIDQVGLPLECFTAYLTSV